MIYIYRYDFHIFTDEISIFMLSDGELQNPPVPKEVMAKLEKMEVEVILTRYADDYNDIIMIDII